MLDEFLVKWILNGLSVLIFICGPVQIGNCIFILVVILEILEIEVPNILCDAGSIGNLKSPTFSVFLELLETAPECFSVFPEILEIWLLIAPGLTFLDLLPGKMSLRSKTTALRNFQRWLCRPNHYASRPGSKSCVEGGINVQISLINIKSHIYIYIYIW